MKVYIAAFCVVGGLLFSAPLALWAEEAPPSIKLLPVVSRDILSMVPFSRSLKSPVFLTHAGDQSGRLFIVEQPSTIRIWDRGSLRQAPLREIKERVPSLREPGLLRLSLQPAARRTRRYVGN